MASRIEPTNQSPPFEDVNLFTSDRVLQSHVEHTIDSTQRAELAAFGARAGSREMQIHARQANDFPPRLLTHDYQGRRLDVVEYHPSYHALMTESCAAGLHASPHAHLLTPHRTKNPHAQRLRAAHFYLAAQMESGHCCPITMTNAAISALTRAPSLASAWLPRALVHDYDPRFRPAGQKSSVTFGMGMTEKQGGTDVRANVTAARPLAGADGEYRIDGHKWFLSAPMSDAFLVLAQAPGGLSCFLVPRFLPDGRANGLRLQRLKHKLGNRSNASSEVEFEVAHGFIVGEEGRGVPAIIEMVTATRLDCAVASAGLMRFALAHAMHHARFRSVFGKPLLCQPLMRTVLADLALDVEAATALSFALAAAFDDAQERPSSAAWRRLMTPVTKYWVCKIAAPMIAEAMECLGGNGYVEELPLARTYREAPVNAIWEGSGNVMALDVLRVVQRDPAAAQRVLADLHDAAVDDSHLASLSERIGCRLRAPDKLEAHARALIDDLARLAAAVCLRKSAPSVVADAFIAARIAAPHQTYGHDLAASAVEALLQRAAPDLSQG